MFVDGKVIIVDDNRLFHNGHHVSLLQEDLVDFFGDVTLQMCLSGADELALCLWKASAFRFSPMECGRVVAANVLRNLSAICALETSEQYTIHSYADTKFVTVYCYAHYCGVLGLSNQDHVVFKLCTKLPNIERVVLHAQTVEAFRMASEESFKAKLRDIMTKRMLFCLEGCNFGICLSPLSTDNQTGLWEQLSVISCIPACQGHLTETSEIVVKCSSQMCDMSLSCPKNKSCTYCYSGYFDADMEAIMVSDFAANITNSCTSLTSQKLETCFSSLNEITPARVLTFSVLMNIERVRSLITFQQLQNVSDEFSVAVFSRQCASRLGIMNGNVLELSCKTHDQQQRHCNSSSIPKTLSETHQQHSCRQKVVIACIDTQQSIGDAMACISSCAWFNLCRMSCMSLTRSCNIKSCYVKVCMLTVY